MNRLLGIGMLSVLMFTTFLTFYQVHHQVRQDFQQQLAMMNQLLVKATTLLLLDDTEQDINAFYSTAQHHAGFPVLSITLLDANKDVISSTGLSTLLQQPEQDWFADQHQILWLHHGRILSSQPLLLDQQVRGYLLLEAGNPPFPWALWLWQLAIWLCLPCLLLLWLWRRSNRQRLLLEQSYQELKQAMICWLEGEPDVPLTQQHPMTGLFNQLTERMKQKQQAHAQQGEELARQLEGIEQSRVALQQQQQQAQQVMQQLSQQQAQTEQETNQLLRLLVQTAQPWQSSLLQDVLYTRQGSVAVQVSYLPDWLAQQAEQWRQLIKPEQTLLLEEDNLASEYQLHLAADSLALCCRALLRLAAQHSCHSQLSLQWRLAVAKQELHFLLLLKGESLPADVCQQLEMATELPARELALDIQLFSFGCKQLSAQVTASCLDELGSSIELCIPCRYEPCAPPSQIAKVHLLAEPKLISPAQLQSLKLVCHQLQHHHSLGEWQAAQSEPTEPLLVVLPEPQHQEAHGYQSLLARPGCLALSTASQLDSWQPFASSPVLPLPQTASELATALQQLEAYSPAAVRLLVVDDNETNQAFIQAMLASFPLQLTAAMTGLQALELCQQQVFDLILMDIQLPDLSGVEVTRQLRQLANYQQVPILAFTAHALPDEIALFKQAGMNDVVIKPLDAPKLTNLMKWCRPRPPGSG
ncbi:response regulator [Alkalimonas amylolytica]|uniref:CheY chemotaxis protein or a CheY-like REC (Receiver) domain n=1 Tax=Alkalimonas amylolytica TaxID=152573 RepID=A0A1H3XHM3_ALKAM|nr:response regulator [Alkalimonas amylolytica]SDZ98849.1 CheY chemotaxis protein or a CheY-like REC (receiver) domain [Alkalimonas amylolytica]